MPRHYVQCVYRQGDRRPYTFHVDGDRPEIGDRMKTLAKENDGSWVKVWVTGYVGTAPSFATKAAEPNPLTADEQAALDAKAKKDEGPGFDD